MLCHRAGTASLCRWFSSTSAWLHGLRSSYSPGFRPRNAGRVISLELGAERLPGQAVSAARAAGTGSRPCCRRAAVTVGGDVLAFGDGRLDGQPDCSEDGGEFSGWISPSPAVPRLHPQPDPRPLTPPSPTPPAATGRLLPLSTHRRHGGLTALRPASTATPAGPAAEVRTVRGGGALLAAQVQPHLRGERRWSVVRYRLAAGTYCS